MSGPVQVALIFTTAHLTLAALTALLAWRGVLTITVRRPRQTPPPPKGDQQ